MLDATSPLPLYHQLAEQLFSDIRAGLYAPGTKIPSEHQLAEAFKLGRPTVRQATDSLIQRGILTRRRGSGTCSQRARECRSVLARRYPRLRIAAPAGRLRGGVSSARGASSDYGLIRSRAVAAGLARASPMNGAVQLDFMPYDTQSEVRGQPPLTARLSEVPWW
jgi:DNA-binding transcriptional regulator YhcF (GntR family)